MNVALKEKTPNPMSEKLKPAADSKVKPVDINLLIVDDETDFRDSATRYFERVGFRVDSAEDGEEALNVTTNKNFDVVILDIHMPGMSGIEVLQKLMERDPPPKVIMLTGGGTIENAVESIKLGCLRFPDQARQAG